MATTTKLQTNDTLRNDMWRACDILRRDNNVGGIMQYTEHLAWLLFLKFLDDEDKRSAGEAAVEDRPFSPVIPKELAWDHWTQLPASEIIQFVRGSLLPGLATLGGPPLATTVRRIFSDETIGDQSVVRSLPVCASGYNLKDVIDIINAIKFDSDQDIFTITAFYEDLLERQGSENRSAGEFQTARPIIRFMVDLIDPKIGETVYDPAYGTAGFLAEAFVHIRSKLGTIQEHEELQNNTIFGNEKKGFSTLLGTMNIVLHGATNPQITKANSLEENVKGIVDNRYDIILTNPPFGGTEGRHIQQNFAVQSNATELLFLQHII
ncbi:MAG: SAM-dependent DNA methyltransferase, partial [Caldilineaceae bacterium]|nr:SAM-dependent DNA methyltransferase [Caldilineaceae bacterium]